MPLMATLQFPFSYVRNCPSCKGYGNVDLGLYGVGPCPECNGLGIVPDPDAMVRAIDSFEPFGLHCKIHGFSLHPTCGCLVDRLYIKRDD
jgi:DnaJ-class molecular chaperone